MSDFEIDGMMDQIEGVKLMDDENDEKVQEIECHARIVAFFAHKGGVSKTTNLYHLGYMLSKQFNFKVLMVDADPQQNLTQTCCRSAKNDANWRNDIERGTIYTAMERLHYGLKDGKYIEPAACVRLHKKWISDNDGELWLLPGSLDLAKLEPQITFAHNVTNPSVFPLFDDIAGGFRHLLISTCAQYSIDFCLIDMGPSIGELNKSLFWASDYFIIPCSPDAYCKTTMKTMERTLPLWYKQQIKLADITSDMILPLNPEPPKFLGILMGLFQVSGKNKKPIKDAQHWMDIIKNTVKDDLAPALQECNMIHEFAPQDYTLSEIPHFLSLMPIAQKSYATVYDIPDNGFVVSSEDGDVTSMPKSEITRHKDRAVYFFDKYEKLAQLLINIFNSEDSIENSETVENDE